MRVAIFALLCCTMLSGQVPEDCKPSTLNIPGVPYPCVYPDRRVAFRVAAPNAQKVQVRLGGAHDMTKGEDGLWMVTIPPQVIGFHYYSIVVDGAVVADPAPRTFFGSGWDNSAIEVPDADAEFYSAKDVPHGAPALVLLEGHRQVAPRVRLHAARVRCEYGRSLPGSLPAPRVG